MGLPLFAPRKALALNTNAPTRTRPVMGQGAVPFTRGREIAALLLWMGALFLVLALWSFAGDPNPPAEGAPASMTAAGENWVGMVGEMAARSFASLVGVVAWAIPLELMLLGIPFVRQKKSLITPARLAGDFLIALLAASMVQVGAPHARVFGHYGAAGMVGELFGELMRSLFSTAGSFLVGFALLALILIGRATFSFIALMQLMAHMGRKSASSTAQGARSLADAWRKARDLDREQREEQRKAALPIVQERKVERAIVAALPPESEDFGVGLSPLPEPAVEGEDDLGSPRMDLTPSAFSDGEPLTVAPKRARKKREPAAKAAPKTPEADTDVSAAPVAPLPEPKEPTPSPELVMVPAAPIVPPEMAAEAKAKRAPKKGDLEPTIIDTSDALKKEPPKKDKMVPAVGEGFRLPSFDFLEPGKVDPSLVIDKDILFKNAELLIKTLADYGVSGKVEEILPGPTVTTYEVSPAAGTKVSKVASLADDLALALARKVRIVAPIPGKNRVGFELPNERRSPVNLRDLVEDQRFRSLDVPLPVVLGRDIVGNPIYADLASMPHVIVAGATGAGKSVGLNVMLTSLLYRRTPAELRMLMIDPKVVELAPFDRIPHMLLPVVTDMKQASNALKWAVDEMERRYQLFADAGTKNITTYNNWVDRVVRGEIRNPFPKVVIAKDHNGLEEGIKPEDGEEGEAPLPERMPFIVIVVDEFADLMMQQGKDVEAAVARLAQKARAAGMHVILATQRPSVDVITGMIKANFPTRIAFRVAQKVDSRTILDEQGAEHLLGRGDMLVRLNGTNETKRVQCPWVSEEEVQAITDFLRLQGEPVYDENILKPRDDDGGVVEEDSEQDPVYDDAVRVVADTRRCSTSWLQRKLGLGYNRAARIVEMMEKRGIVGPANGAKDREVLISAL
jgi:DNA segregation ATPase FtsK/SpoIIIE, S-DNA-T family